MTVESATYIAQLAPANPGSNDPKSEGDDHLRLIKTVLQAQFPNFGNAAVTPTAAQVNQLTAGNLTLTAPAFYPNIQFTDTALSTWIVGGDGVGANTNFQITLGSTVMLKIDSNGNVSCTGVGSLGYGTGSGGAAVQATNKTGSVTLNTSAGQITMNNAALGSGAVVTFLLINSKIFGPDNLIVSCGGGNATAGTYTVAVDSVTAGQAVIQVKNISGGSLSEAIKINFAVFKGATS